MSASSDYTLTPNLGLFKPIANAAVGLWGDLLNTNADTIDSAIHASTGGGPYLPLAGNATVFGPTTYTAPLIYTATSATTARAAQDRAHDTVNVKDFGATLNGTADDTTAFQAAVNASPADGTILVPRGGINVGVITNPAGNTLWKLDGNYQGTGTTPVQYLGASGDVTETFTQGRKSFYKRVTTTQNGYVLNVALDHQYPSGGAVVSSGLHVYANTAASIGSTFVWGLNSELYSYANGSNQNQAGCFTTRKFGTSPCFGVSGITYDMTGLPSSTGGGLVCTELDTFADYADDAVNGARSVLRLVIGRSTRTDSSTNMTVHTILSLGPQPIELTHASADRMINLYGTFNTSGLECRNSTQGAGAHAIWMKEGQSIAFDNAGVVTLTGNSTSITCAGRFATTDNATFQTRAAIGTTATTAGVALDIVAATGAGIRTSGATLTGAAIRMGADQFLSFTATDSAYLQFRQATQRLYYVVSGVDMWSVDASGNVRAKGTLTGSTTP